MLESWGWYVMRSAGSKGLLDLVAIRNGRAIGFQVKVGRISEVERAELENFAKKYNIRVFIAVWDRKKRKWRISDAVTGTTVALKFFREG